MKKIYHKITAYFAVVMLFVFAGVMQIQAAEYEATDIEKNMLVGDVKEYYGLDYRTEDGTEHLMNFDSVDSSAPSVISAVNMGNGFSLEAVGKGSAVITVTKNDVVATATVTVYSDEEYGIELCKENRTMQIGEEFEINDVTYYYGDTVETIKLAYCMIDTSDEDVVALHQSPNRVTFMARNAGEATITIKTLYPKKIEESFVITVPKKEGAPTPVMPSQIKTIKNSINASIYDDSIYVGIEPGKIDSEFEIYVSDKKNKGFKKVGWAKTTYLSYLTVESSSSEDSYNPGRGNSVSVQIKKYKKKKLKANKKYYAKIRVRYTDKNYSNEWSNFSAVKEYWTAPSQIPKKKIKYNNKTGKLSFPKVKNVAGYQYGMGSTEFVGYNIFGGRIYDSERRSVCTTKTSLTAKKISGNKFADNVGYVIPYAKHKGYYYMNGFDPFKSLKGLESYEGERWASKP